MLMSEKQQLCFLQTELTSPDHHCLGVVCLGVVVKGLNNLLLLTIHSFYVSFTKDHRGRYQFLQGEYKGATC